MQNTKKTYDINIEIESLKCRINTVKREMGNAEKGKKSRLNQYKQKLEIQLRELTRMRNMGVYSR